MKDESITRYGQDTSRQKQPRMSSRSVLYCIEIPLSNETRRLESEGTSHLPIGKSRFVQEAALVAEGQ